MSLKQFYNGVIHYFWPTESQFKQEKQEQENASMPILTRLKRLRTLLQESNYKELHREQICMFYSSLVKEYAESKSSYEFPKFLYEPEIYSMKIFFIVPLSINTEQIKGLLQLFIMFPEQMDQEMPLFFIKNPDYEKFKPNKKCVSFGKESEGQKPFQAILGGLKVKLPKISNERWQWTSSLYYKEENIVNMVRYIHKHVIMECFPFVGRKKGKADEFKQEAKALKDFLRCLKPERNQTESLLLSNIQYLDILEKSIDCEINQTYQDIQDLKKEAKVLQESDISQYLPVVSDKRSQILLDSLSNIEAIKDSIFLLQNKFQSKEISLQQFKDLSQPLFQQQFDNRIRYNFHQPPELLQP